MLSKTVISEKNTTYYKRATMTNKTSDTTISKIFNYLKAHKVSFGLSLAAYGAYYLSLVIISGWTLSNWGDNIITYFPFPITSFLSSNLINPIFFATSLSTLIAGTAILCGYSIHAIKPEATDNKERVAIVLTIFGFTYQVIGAWPLGIKDVFPWEWQKQIISFGGAFAWTLTLLSLTTLAFGGISLFIQSKIYHQKHPEFREIKLQN